LPVVPANTIPEMRNVATRAKTQSAFMVRS
jgi:hypothetical protein